MTSIRIVQVHPDGFVEGTMEFDFPEQLDPAVLKERLLVSLAQVEELTTLLKKRVDSLEKYSPDEILQVEQAHFELLTAQSELQGELEDDPSSSETLKAKRKLARAKKRFREISKGKEKLVEAWIEK